MTASSGGPRPTGADDKKNYADERFLSTLQRADCAALDAAVTAVNLGKRGRERISDGYLARMAVSLGGAEDRAAWWRYRHARRAIPLVDQMIAAMVLRTRPQDLFPSWKFSDLTRIPPGAQLPQLTTVLAALPPQERDELLYIIDSWLNIKSMRTRSAIYRAVLKIMGDTGKTRSKARSKAS